MTEVLVKIPDSQLPFFLDLLELLQFAEIEEINSQKFSKKEFLNQFSEALNEAKLHLEGKVKLRPIKEVLNEL